MAAPAIDHTGQRIEKLKVLGRSKQKNRYHRVMWECECLACGKIFTVWGQELRKKKPRHSCGCVRPKRGPQKEAKSVYLPLEFWRKIDREAESRGVVVEKALKIAFGWSL